MPGPRSRDETRQVLRGTRLIVYALYGGVGLYAASVILRLPPIGAAAVPEAVLKGPLLLAAVASFVLAVILGEQRLGPARLRQKHEEGAVPAAREIQAGAVIMAALGDVCGSLGLVYYLLAGQGSTPLLFFALSAAHALMTLKRLGQAEKDLRASADAEPC